MRGNQKYYKIRTLKKDALMKKKIIMASVSALMCSIAVAAFDCQTSVNGIGDWNVVTVGGFTFGKIVSIDLAPTNAPDMNMRYSARCRIIYRDNLIQRPMSDDEFEQVRDTGDTLNLWLKEFVADEYAGLEYDDLLDVYIRGEFAQNLNECFPKYVADEISKMAPGDRFDIDTVTVVIAAEGAFKEDLESEMKKKEALQESE